MKTSFVLLLIISATRVAEAEEAKKSPIKKIIQMLSDMQAKGKKEKQDEQVRFASYSQFCKSTADEKASSIASGKEAIEQLTAAIAKAEADASVLGKEITQHEADVVNYKAELEEASEERKKEHAAFNEAHKEYTESIDSVERALAHLEKNLPGAAASFVQSSSSVFALLQTSGHVMPQRTKKVLMSFLQIHDPDMARKAREALLQEAAEEGVNVAPPEVATYESSSGGIVEMIEELGSKFEDERMELEKREANAKNAFLMMSKDLTGSISEAEMMIGAKKSTKATRLEDAAEAKGDLADTEAAVAEDTKFLADLDAECKQKTFDYEQRQIVRTGEIEAIGKAIEIMSSPEVAGGAAHTLFVQQAIFGTRAGVSLAQLRSTDQSSKQQDVAAFLQQRAKMANSRLLALMAQRAAADPFKKVKKMIQDMISKLMEEANEAADHKAFCDAEMSTNKQTRDSKTTESEELKADIEGLTADIAKLGEEITDLASQISAIDAAVKKATEDRNAEKAKNTDTITDAEVANNAVTQAITILKEFYEKAAVPVEQPAPIKGPIKWDPRAMALLKPAMFIQTGSSVKSGQPGAPEMEEGAYTGMGNGGVLGLMEVCQSDFEKLISETSATEAEAAKIYDEFMADSDQDKAVKGADQKHKMTAKTGKESKLATAKKDLRITEEELAAAMAYYEKLKPSCEEKVMSYEEKVAQRKAEIESLKEALEILS